MFDLSDNRIAVTILGDKVGAMVAIKSSADDCEVTHIILEHVARLHDDVQCGFVDVRTFADANIRYWTGDGGRRT